MANIKQFLIDNDLKQVELARFLGITEASVSKMAKGTTNPSNANLQKILDNDRGWDTASLFLKETRNDSYLREENGSPLSLHRHSENRKKMQIIDIHRVPEEQNNLFAVIRHTFPSV